MVKCNKCQAVIHTQIVDIRNRQTTVGVSAMIVMVLVNVQGVEEEVSIRHITLMMGVLWNMIVNIVTVQDIAKHAMEVELFSTILTPKKRQRVIVINKKLCPTHIGIMKWLKCFWH